MSQSPGSLAAAARRASSTAAVARRTCHEPHVVPLATNPQRFSPGGGVAEFAADYAFTFLNQFANVALSALMKQHLLNDVQKQLAQLQREDVHKFLGRLQQEQSNMYKKVVSVSTVATDLERLERNLRSNMSTHVLDMLGHSHRGIQ